MKSSTVIFDNVAIVGVGLIGGSLGMAARKKGLSKRVIGVGRQVGPGREGEEGGSVTRCRRIRRASEW